MMFIIFGSLFPMIAVFGETALTGQKYALSCQLLFPWSL